MKEQLEQQLYEKYPKIFRQKDLPMNQTCMCWGISCKDGWYQIIDDLCHCIQSHCKSLEQNLEWDKKSGKNLNVKPEDLQIEAVQVKQKFGGLRFYTNHSDEYTNALISFASYLSYRTCEQCGSRDRVKQTDGGWIEPLCKSCYRKRQVHEWCDRFLYKSKLYLVKRKIESFRYKHFPTKEQKEFKKMLEEAKNIKERQ